MAHRQAAEAAALRQAVGEVAPRRPEAEVGLLPRVAEAAARPDHADHAGILVPAALLAAAEAAVFRPRCPAPGQELEVPLQMSGRSR